MKKIYKNTILSVYENQDNVVNPTFLKCRINILDTSSVAKHTHFKKENVDKSIYQLDYLPVRGLYKEGEEEFGGHEISYYIDEEGNLKELVGTVPMGVVIKNSARWENINNKETLVCDCYIWTDNNEGAVRRIKENCVSQSMEININSYSETNKDYIEIEEFTFTSLTLIDTQPAFNCGSIRTYSKENGFKAEYQKMLNALDKYLNYEEGSKKSDMENNKEKELEQEEFAKKKKCEDEEIKENMEDKAEDDKEEKEKDFAKDKKKCEEEKSKEYEAKIEALNKDYSELQEKYSSLENDSNDLKAKYEQLLNEVTGLRQYKADKELEYRQSEEQRIFSQFEDIKELEQFNKIVEAKADYSLEELEEKCWAVYGKLNKEKFSKNKSKQKETNPVVDKVYSAEGLENNKIDKVSSLIEKYSKR